jgi:hypothetical protein
VTVHAAAKRQCGDGRRFFAVIEHRSTSRIEMQAPNHAMRRMTAKAVPA